MQLRGTGDPLRDLGGGFFTVPNYTMHGAGHLSAVALVSGAVGVGGAFLVSKENASTTRLVVGTVLAASVPALWITTMALGRFLWGKP